MERAVDVLLSAVDVLECAVDVLFSEIDLLERAIDLLERRFDQGGARRHARRVRLRWLGESIEGTP